MKFLTYHMIESVSRDVQKWVSYEEKKNIQNQTRNFLSFTPYIVWL